VNKIIEGMHSDGTLSELSNKWFGEDLTKIPTKQTNKQREAAFAASLYFIKR
jgi:hypothetical protein